jgi:hypothetical protein
MKKQLQTSKLNWVKNSFAILLFLLSGNIAKAATYYWVGSTTAAAVGAIGTLSTTFGGTANVALITPTASDIIIFDGSDISSAVGLQTGTITFNQAAASYNFGQMILQNNAIVVYSNTSAGRNINIGGGLAGIDFSIGAGSSFNPSGSSIAVNLLTGNTGSISGSYLSGGGSNTHQLLVADAGALTFQSGSNFTPNAAGNHFGTTNLNSVIFASGATYTQAALGANPFGAATPNSVVTFQSGSIFNVTANIAIAAAGRTYGNLVINSGTFSQTLTGGNALTVQNNLTITNTAAGGLILNLTGGVNIGGNVSVVAGKALSFNTTNAGNVTFNGSTAQTINNAGTLTFPANASVFVSNPAGVTFQTAQTISGSTTVNANALLATSATLTLTGTPTINGNFQINQGAWATGGTWSYGAAGGLIFNNSSGVYGVSNTDVFIPALNSPKKIFVNGAGGVNFNSITRAVADTFLVSAAVQNHCNFTLNGYIILNTGYSFTACGVGPAYGCSSTLQYKTGSNPQVRGNEWTTAQTPGNVQISNNTTMNFPVNGNAVICGNLTIDAGSSLFSDYSGGSVSITVPGNVTVNGNLSLGGSNGGDLFVGGNFTQAASGASINFNGRAVTFNGTSTQILTKTGGGVLDFNGTGSSAYFLINKTAGNVQLATSTNVTLGTSVGDVLQINNTGGLDLNGQTFSLTGTGGNIRVSGGARSIISTIANATFALSASSSGVTAKTVTSAGGGTLTFAPNVTITMASGNFDFGSVSTVNGTYQLNTGGGTLPGTGPIYGASSNLVYNSITEYNRSGEWTATGVGTIGVTQGYPNNVTVTGTGTIFDLGNGGAATARACEGNLTIVSPATFTMAKAENPMTASLTVKGNIINGGNLNLSTSIGGDLFTQGNFTNGASGTFTHNNRQVTFNNATATQTIAQTGGGTIAFGYLAVNKATSNNVVLSSSPATNVSVSGDLTLTNQNFDVNGQTLFLNGTVTKTSGFIVGSGNNSTTVFVGPSIIQNNLFTSNTAYGVTINRAGGVSMGGDLIVSGALIQASGNFTIAGNTLTLGGTITNDATNALVGSNTSKLVATTGTGTAYFGQLPSADVAVTNGSNALQDLSKTGAGTFTLGNKVNLFNKLTLTGGTLATGNFLVLRSTTSNTAWVPNVTGAISGQVTVERYIHKTTRGWRGLTAPITFNGIISGNNNTIKENWQSDFGYSGNYGTRVTGGSIVPSGANGLDDVNPSPNMQTWNPVTQTWTKVLNTYSNLQSNSTASAANIPYFLFVRGDRTVVPNQYAGWVQTTLAAKGLLQTGNQVFTLPAGSQTGAGKSWSIGNPYACPVDMSLVSFSANPSYIYVWVPEIPNGIPNTTTTGKYITFDRATWAILPPGGTTTANQYFQSGQIFFIEPSTAGETVTFTEASKVAVATNNVAVTGKANGITDLFNINLINVDALGNKTQIDGARAKFGDGFNSDVDRQDALKWSTATVENLSLKRNGKSLVIEARPFIVGVDSLFVNTTNLVVGNNYEFAINPINFDASVSSCVLIDNFLNTQTPISLRTITNVPFNITATTGSNATNRFTIVFNGSGTLPNNNNLTVKAFKKDKTVEVNWDVTAETGMKIYNVEKSVTGNDYKQLGTATAKNGNKANTYSIIDNNPVIGVNYYRVQGVLMNDNSLYSAVVRVEMNSNGIKSVTVYPNPVKGNVIGLQLNNLDQGVYTAKLTTTTGQQVWSKTINHNGNNGSLSVQLNKKVAQGSYQLQLIDAKGNAYSQNVLVVE